MLQRWRTMGNQLGVGISVLGFVLLFLGWNGAASYDRIAAQFPYLISGGLAGLALVVVGAGLTVVHNARADRAHLQAAIAELSEAVERLTLASTGPAVTAALPTAAAFTPPGMVVAGPTAYHRPDCRLLEGRAGLPLVDAGEAEARGLSPCRACDAVLVRTEAIETLAAEESAAARPRRASRTRKAKTA